jgi:hypothetical protein
LELELMAFQAHLVYCKSSQGSATWSQIGIVVPWSNSNEKLGFPEAEVMGLSVAFGSFSYFHSRSSFSWEQTAVG